MNREQDARLQAQGTMEEIAKDTGGKTCTNTNDLSGCVETALNNSSSYYELAFYPENVKWDGSFQKIEVKTSRRGVRLSYRRGYFAMDADTLAKGQKPEERLRQACSDPLPPTAIRMMAQAVPSAGRPGEKYELTYLLLIAPGEMSLPQTGDAREIRIRAATCDFNAKGDSFQFFQQDLTQRVSDDVLKNWQAQGIPDLVGVAANADTRRIRIAILDEPTGLTGAVDIPVRPADLERAAKSASIAAASATPVLEIADKQPAKTPPQPMAALVFHGQNGQSGTLDWNGDTLIYQGDLGAGQTAPAFFTYALGTKFQCQSGSLVATSPAGGEPTLLFTFRNHNGKVAVVDLNGAQPEYSGDLPVDSNVRAFFDEVWRLCHCLAR